MREQLTHFYGGVWSDAKNEVLTNYLQLYSTALKNKSFQRIYIDAFAGTGERHQETLDEGTLAIPGSVKRALEVDPPFHRYYFVERHPARYQQLRRLCDKYPDRDIRPFCEDSNTVICRLCDEINWRHTRAVMFLDPYGLSVQWETLERIAQTEAIDLWYLFSLAGLYRQAPHRRSRQDGSKQRRLDQTLGTTEWRNAFYPDSGQDDLFGHEADPSRLQDWQPLLQFVRQRLGTLFSRVPEPLVLPKKGSPMSALFFACANPNPKAQGLSMRAANHILKQAR